MYNVIPIPEIGFDYRKKTLPADLNKELIFTAEVLDVILNDSHPDWANFKRPGIIKYRAIEDKNAETKNIISYAAPLQVNFLVTPIIGECVIVIKSLNVNSDDRNFLINGVSYYLNPVSLFSDSNSNIIGKLLLGTAADDTEKDSVTFREKELFGTKLYEGYINYEGRFGQNILFGATAKSDKISSEIGSNSESVNGDPFIIIRSGIKSYSPNINLDLASHYITSTQIIKLFNPSFETLADSWTTVNMDINSNDQEPMDIIQEPIQNSNSISIDPRSNYTNSEKIIEDETNETGNFGIPLYNQGDIRWGQLKSSQEPYTMKEAGCALVSLAMLISYLKNDATITPDKLFYIKNKVLVYWNDIIDHFNTNSNIILNYPIFIRNPKSLAEVDVSLQSKVPVLLETKNKEIPLFGKTIKNNIVEAEGPSQKPYVRGSQHWMLITNKNEDGTYDIHDPNGGRKRINQSADFILKKASRFGIISI